MVQVIAITFTKRCGEGALDTFDLRPCQQLVEKEMLRTAGIEENFTLEYDNVYLLRIRRTKLAVTHGTALLVRLYCSHSTRAAVEPYYLCMICSSKARAHG